MPTEVNEKVALTAPKGIMTVIVVALLGGGTGVAAYHAATPATAQASPPVVEVIGAGEARSRAYADQAVDKAREDCRREQAQAQANLSATLVRVEKKLDDLAESTTTLKADVAVLKSDVSDLKSSRRR